MANPNPYPRVVTGTTPPNPKDVPVGALWFNRSKGKLYILYNDGRDKRWMEILGPVRS
jgi:hypothetical protein